MAETVIAQSDYIDVQVSHSDTILLAYTNENDFASIVFSGAVRPTFYIRLWAKFFRERFPEENESEELSSNVVVKLSGTVKSQKLLQIEIAPFYFHKMVKLALQHNYILINSLEWEKEENYETKNLNEKYPFETAEVWLTQKENGYYVNVYGNV